MRITSRGKCGIIKDMKHRHCHCRLRERLQDLKAGKLGLLGGVLIIGHLLFHVAECLVLPAIFMAANSNASESLESLELTAAEMHETHTHDLFSALNLNGRDLTALTKFANHSLNSE